MLLRACTATTKHMQFGLSAITRFRPSFQPSHIDSEYKIYNVLWLQNLVIQLDEYLSMTNKNS
jgi:hypothetical protein